VTEYYQNVFLPSWAKFKDHIRVWTDYNNNIDLRVDKDANLRQDIKNTVVWFHDKSIFYAHDHHSQCWVHAIEGPKPQPKGKGVSLMVAHFISADYSYLQSPDGTEAAHILFKASKGQSPLFTSSVPFRNMDMHQMRTPPELVGRPKVYLSV